MKFLLDTNELIPVEPGSLGDVEPGTSVVANFIKLCNEAKQQLYVHPVIVKDLERDKNDDRRQLRKLLIGKYATLPHPPGLEKVEPTVGAVDAESNDWVDHHLLAAILGNAADYVVIDSIGYQSRSKLDATRAGVRHFRCKWAEFQTALFKSGIRKYLGGLVVVVPE
jgi:hypothetical protein